MFNKIARRFFLVLLGLFFLSGSNCGQNDPSSSHPSMGQPTAAYGTTGNANGGPGAQASSMNGTASVLANTISNYRAHAGLPTVSANDVLTGVAQAQADDMAASNAVGLVGTDGEDAFQRLANSGYTNATVAVIAAGYGTDPTAIYDAMLTDNGANQSLLLGNSAFKSIGVGYSNGYWMVILGNTGTGTTGTGTLSAPTLSAMAGTGSVALSWTAVSGATSYDIYRGTVSGGESSYQTGIATTSYSDTTVTGGTTYYYTVTAVNSSGSSSQSNEDSATPTASSSLQITTTTLAVSVWDASLAGYSSTIAATGGTGAVTFTSGAGLPPGLTLGASGSLTGTPTTAATYNFTVTATDSVSNTATKSYTLLINPAVSIVTTTVPNGTKGTAYSAPIQTAGGTGAITLSVTSGSLPPGITLNGSGSGTVSTFVSSGLSQPDGLAFDKAGNLYVSNISSNSVSRVTPAGVISSFFSGDGLIFPAGLALDAAGNLYIAGSGSNSILKVTPAGVASTFASVNGPQGLAFDSAGNLYATNQTGNLITKITPAGVTSTFVSGLTSPLSLAFDTAGNLYVGSQTVNNSIIKVTPAGATSTFATGFSNVAGLAFDTAGNLYAANYYAGTISRLTPAGVTSTFATVPYQPSALAFDTAGNLYVPSYFDNTISKVTPGAAGGAGLSGTPTTAGTYNFTVTATDTLGDTATQAYTVTIP